MARNNILLAGLFFLLVQAGAQPNRYMVFFKDKNNTPYALTNPLSFLSEKAVARRIQHNTPIVVEDLPVNPGYVQQVKDAGAQTYFTTRWMNGVLVQCDPSVAVAISSLPAVQSVEMVAPGERLLTTGRVRQTQKVKGGKATHSTSAQLQMLGLSDMHSAGYRGEGITIAIFDGGFLGVDAVLPFQHIFTEGRMDLAVSKDFVRNTDNVFQYDDHGTEVFSVIAGYSPPDFTGGAYKANFQLYVTEDVTSEHRVEEYNWLFAAERADSAGADIIQSSLGYYSFDTPSASYPMSAMDGNTAVVTRAANHAAARGIVVVVSAGNEGNIAWGIITAPADAENILAVGNVNLSGQRVASSSKGPTADGRIKPDVVALGANTAVITATGSTGTSSGTSLSAPLITSLVAGVMQRYPSMRNEEVMDAIRLSASNAATPNFFIGYGIPNFKAVVNWTDFSPGAKSFQVYPNPVRDTLRIKINGGEENPEMGIELLSSTGQRLSKVNIQFSWANNIYSLPVSDLASGLYMLRIYYKDKVYTEKVIKE